MGPGLPARTSLWASRARPFGTSVPLCQKHPQAHCRQRARKGVTLMKPIVRNAILVATLIVLPGCPSQQVLMTPDDRLSLSSQPHIIAIHYPPEEIFRLRYPGEILGGPFVTLAAQYEAARLKRDLRLEDPALDVKDRLVNALRANFNITKVRTVSEYPH